jgi:ankyrin repeat protein
MASIGAGADNGSDSVYRAVSAGESEQEVRRLIEACAVGSATRLDARKRRAAAVNRSSSEGSGETPLQAAHRLNRGDLVGALLEHGAEADDLFDSGECDALALCIHYNEVGTLRALLGAGCDPNKKLAYGGCDTLEGSGGLVFCRAAHLCILPPRRSSSDPLPEPRLQCLEVLVREFGADVDGRDQSNSAPTLWLAEAAPEHHKSALDALISLGADLDASGVEGRTPLLLFARAGNLDMVQDLLRRGASADIITRDGWTPLIAACTRGDGPPAAFAALARASSPSTRRVRLHGALTALDIAISWLEPSPDGGEPLREWQQEVAFWLLRAGVPVAPHHAERVLPVAARLIRWQDAELVRRERSGAMCWQAHDAIVGLAFDFLEMREAEEAVARRERRVEELEAELRALGVGTEDTDEEEEDEEEEDDDEGGEDEDGTSAGQSEELRNSGSGSDDDVDDEESQPSASAAADLARALQGVRCGDDGEEEVKEEVDEQESG